MSEVVSRERQNTVHKVWVLEAFLRNSETPDLFCNFKTRHCHVRMRRIVVHQLQVLHPFFRCSRECKQWTIMLDRRLLMFARSSC